MSYTPALSDRGIHLNTRTDAANLALEYVNAVALRIYEYNVLLNMRKLGNDPEGTAEQYQLVTNLIAQDKEILDHLQTLARGLGADQYYMTLDTREVK